MSGGALPGQVVPLSTAQIHISFGAKPGQVPRPSALTDPIGVFERGALAGGTGGGWCWGLSGGAGVFAEVGPATLTTDPWLFQQRLRELQVQVRSPQPLTAAPGLLLGGKLSSVCWWVPGAVRVGAEG